MAYYTDEERKEPFEYDVTHFHFKAKKDLSGSVRVYQKYNHDIDLFTERPDRLASEVAQFITRWMILHQKHLNGFSGMDTVEFKLIRNEP